MTSRCLFPFVVMIRGLGKQHSAVGAHSPGRQRLWQAFCAHGLRRLIPVTTPAPSWPVIRKMSDVHEWFDSHSLCSPQFTVQRKEHGQAAHLRHTEH